MQLPPPRECDSTEWESRLRMSPSAHTARPPHDKHKHAKAFTLIELSIVLVIIGLIVGGVLVGQSLIAAAAVRAQIAQIEKFQTAAATFQGKYGGLPGDLSSTLAAQFGFLTRAGTAGRGDGNGELDGLVTDGTTRAYNESGENLLFWEDLSSAKLVDGNFTTYVDGNDGICNSSSSCATLIPSAKIGRGNFVYTYSGYAANCPGGGGCIAVTGIGPNFFGLTVLNGFTSNVTSGGVPLPGLTVSEAYNIDKKMDDGMPTTGKVLAQYLTAVAGHPGWSTNSTTDSASTCYNSGTNAYSVTVSSGANVNCGLSFQFQAGD